MASIVAEMFGRDLRQLFEGDVRFLSHYGFKPLDFPTLAGGLSSWI